MTEYQRPSQSNDWYTPAYIFAALGVKFDMDVAAPRDGPLHVPCSHWLFEASLDQPWQGFIWMNPPFGARNGLEPWLEKFVAHGDGIALVPDRTSAPWFQWFARRVEVMLFLAPKPRFIRPDGSIGKSPGNGAVLCAIGKTGVAALKWGHGVLGFAVAPLATLEVAP